MPKIKVVRDDVLDEAEVIMTFNRLESLQMKAIVYLMWFSGARVGEVVMLKLKDIKDGENFIEINMPTLKQRKQIIPRRVLKIPKDKIFYPFFKRHILSIRPQEGHMALFDLTPFTIWYELKKANPDIYPHLFRHSRATILSEKVDVFDMKETFGWSDLQMANTYVHRKNVKERVFDALLDEE